MNSRKVIIVAYQGKKQKGEIEKLKKKAIREYKEYIKKHPKSGKSFISFAAALFKKK